ncbi:MAG TPA: aldose 1-epimerase family protein [Geothrix sp.]|nr:aldose 1-epimerase family protein [Geothrix sp.]
MTEHILRSGDWEARVAACGAELHALRHGNLDLLWDAGPLWPRHAPLLFPVVGGLKSDRLRHQGAAYPMPKHGFARDLAFAWTATSEAACSLVLEDSPATRAAYPWPFRLQVSYALFPAGLRMEIELRNPGRENLPASLGLHPAFRWPLVPGAPRAAHSLRFDLDEPGPLRRLDGMGLLRSTPLPTPIRNRRIQLDEGLFQDDALIFLEPRSRALRFETEDGPALDLRWEGFPHLGIWTKPDPASGFLCIEPWEGYASPEDWDGEFCEKPGTFILEPGTSRHWSLSLALIRRGDQAG